MIPRPHPCLAPQGVAGTLPTTLSSSLLEGEHCAYRSTAGGENRRRRQVDAVQSCPEVGAGGPHTPCFRLAPAGKALFTRPK